MSDVRPNYPHQGQAIRSGGQVTYSRGVPDSVHVDVQDGRPMWQSVLSSIKDVIVIVTCLAILYTMWRGYVALQTLGEELSKLQGAFGA